MQSRRAEPFVPPDDGFHQVTRLFSRSRDELAPFLGLSSDSRRTTDIAFPEDESRVGKDHAPHNLATLRHIALNLLKQETSLKVGVKAKRLRPAWDEHYLLKVLSAA